MFIKQPTPGRTASYSRAARQSQFGQEKKAGDRIRTDDIHVGNVML